MVKTCKEEAIESISKLLDSLEIQNSKKCELLSNWIKTYVEYLNYEDKFDPKRLCRYRKGEILKVNLGFNIGSEEGGVHYCMVLENENSKNSPVVTVIPLTSVKENKDLSKLKKGEVYLEDELYLLLNLKLKEIEKEIKKSIEDIKDKILEDEKILESLSNTLIILKNNISSDKLNELEKIISDLEDKEKEQKEQLEKIKNSNKILDKIKEEIKFMKKGSIALINQITTISKLKIIDPKKSHISVLKGIKISSKKLDLIDAEIKKMYFKS